MFLLRARDDGIHPKRDFRGPALDASVGVRVLLLHFGSQVGSFVWDGRESISMTDHNGASALRSEWT